MLFRRDTLSTLVSSLQTTIFGAKHMHKVTYKIVHNILFQTYLFRFLLSSGNTYVHIYLSLCRRIIMIIWAESSVKSQCVCLFFASGTSTKDWWRHPDNLLRIRPLSYTSDSIRCDYRITEFSRLVIRVECSSPSNAHVQQTGIWKKNYQGTEGIYFLIRTWCPCTSSYKAPIIPLPAKVCER